MNLKQSIKQKREEYPKKMPTLMRIKIGRVLMIYASLPLLSFWAYGIALPIMIPIKPTLWAKDKIRQLKINLWSLR